MAARPFRRNLLNKIKSLGGWSHILDRIAGGETMTNIARDIGCSRPFLSRLLHENPEIADLLSQAQRDCAHGLAEEGMQILDDAPAERDEFVKAKARAEYRKWLATVYDKKTFGEDKQQAQINVSIGDLHLDALRAFTVPSLPAPVALLSPPSEASVEG